MLGFAPLFPHTWPRRRWYISLIGQDQISVGKKHSATLLLNMGIICACKSLVSLPLQASRFLQEVRVYDNQFKFTTSCLGYSTEPLQRCRHILLANTTATQRMARKENIDSFILYEIDYWVHPASWSTNTEVTSAKLKRADHESDHNIIPCRGGW